MNSEAIEVGVRAQGEVLMREILADQEAHHNWDYHAVRPMPVYPAPWKPRVPRKGDCSKGGQYICHWIPHCPDPMGNGWSPWGNSQTVWAHLQHLNSPEQLKVLDMITFGHWGEDHLAVVLVPGVDPVLWSFGHQGAPNTYALSQDHRPAQYLRLPVVYVPTHDDELRSRTTWFAWVAWKLGEGDWRHHNPGDPRVRPNVPARISAQWWARYAQFMANRRRPNKATI